MKRFRTIFSAMVLSFAFVAFLSSCSDDDKDTPEVPAANSVAGVYEGEMTCSVMGQESIFEDMTFTLSVIDDATVKIVISEFGNPPMKVPSINIDGVKVSGEDGKYSLAPTNLAEISMAKHIPVWLKALLKTKSLPLNSIFNMEQCLCL